MKKVKEWVKTLLKTIFTGVGLWILVIIAISGFLAGNRLMLVGIDFWQIGVPLAAVIFLAGGFSAHLITVGLLMWVALCLNRNMMNYRSRTLVKTCDFVDLNTRKTPRQRLSRAFWQFVGRCGVTVPRESIEQMNMLGMAGRGDEAMAVLYEIGGSITRADEKNPCIEQGDTWDEATGQIVDIDQNHVGNIYNDRFIRGRENTDYNPNRNYIL